MVGFNYSCGMVIDLMFCDEYGNIFDMGVGFDEMYECFYVYYFFVLFVVQCNWLLLNVIMIGGGFVGIFSEWWYFELFQAVSYFLFVD